MGLNDIVSVAITTTSVQPTQEGFGTPLVVGACQNYTGQSLVATYQQLSDMLLDGFLATDPEYLAADAICAQSPRPPSFKVAKRSNPPTLVYTVTVPAAAPAGGWTYVVSVNGHQYAYTAAGNATAAAIAAGIEALIAADTGAGKNLPNVVASYTAAATNFTLTGAAAGDWFSVVVDTSVLDLDCDATAPTDETTAGKSNVATDMSAIEIVDNDWYGVVSTFPCDSTIEAMAKWVEADATPRIFCAATPATAVMDLTAAADTSSVAYELKNAAYARSWVFYYPDASMFADAALFGTALPDTPGSETWKFKTLVGVPAVVMTPTQKTNVQGKNAMTYTAVGGINITENGCVAQGEWIDTIRFRDSIAAALQTNVFALLASAKKQPFTDAGISGVEAVIKAVLLQGVADGGFASDPEPAVIVPLAANVSSSDKSTRTLSGITWTATLAGAIHAVSLSGTISV